MKVCVYGLWHLGSVTAACLAAAEIETVGLDDDATTTSGLAAGRPPLFEPGLSELTAAGLASGRLSFTTDPAAALAGAAVVWVAFDTPVDDDDRADVGFVVERIAALFPYLEDGAVVLISAQLPVGTTAGLERRFAAVAAGRAVSFACSPENLRLGKAIEAFRNPGRIVVGVRDDRARAVLEPLLARFCDALLWVGVESAEMTKHALNAFLATCVVFINEIASVCERVGADAGEVEAALRAEPRIGPHAYLRPGAAFAGGTLARDVTFLGDIAADRGLATPLLSGVLPSNQSHRKWAFRRLQTLLGDLRGRTVAVLGLSYKPGTDALRRSIAVELCRDLVAAGAHVRVCDPVVAAPPDDLAGRVTTASSVASAFCSAASARSICPS
ncbi:MAG TPA: nucleotide sugar dehydrogenase, partial [Azospirillaceae bacterium]|nr:nucleotide sugar dehydrogenase [Azospirillaceae bacterium]